MAKKPNENDVAFIEALAELLSTQNLTEIEVNRNYSEGDSLNVRISKTQNIVQATASPLEATSAAPIISPTLPISASTASVDDPSSHPGVVSSPMVGTVYLQAEPGSPAFISIGATVAEGDTILIIEAMKTMNQIPAPHAGIIKRILVEDGGPVEFGSPLVIIE